MSDIKSPDYRRLQLDILNEKVKAIMDFLVTAGRVVNDNEVGHHLADAFQALDQVKLLTAKPVFRVYLTNHDYYHDHDFDNSESALDYGRHMGFEVSIIEFRDGQWFRLISTHSPIGGTRFFV